MITESQSATNPASLSNLNPIVVPDPVPFWPPASGWYVLAAILLALLAWYVIRAIQRYRRNRYRREALAELGRLGQEQTPESIRAVPSLLKRTALAAFPRRSVAPASGAEWLRFLENTAPGAQFEHGAGALLEKAAYGSAELDGPELSTLFAAVESWIRQHRAEPR